jgi:hypothetical protein
MPIKKEVAQCPCCLAGLTYDQVKSLWGAATSAQRKTFPAGPALNPDRCPCGKFTRTRAASRGHVCEQL